MTKAIEIITQPRLFLLNVIEELSLEQLNKIPKGFNNNIAWNLGHLVAAEQGVCYLRAGVDMRIDTTFHNTYKPGSRPERLYTTEDIAQIKTLLTWSLEHLQADIQTDLFDNYIPWTTRYGVAINSIEDAVRFLPFHEGLHIGTIRAMTRIL